MCGIAGIMTADGRPPDADLLERLADAMGHRGPDGRGRHVAGPVGLVQTRLAIIDLATGDQPIFATTPRGGRAAIVANAEIYNYVELRRDMADVPYSTQSDCEPPLHVYLRDGIEYTGSLRGMYAIAIHDPDAECLVLSRDPFGIKPLYYVEDGAGFAFASEPHALIDAGRIGAALDAGARDQLLQLQFTTGRATIFKGIMRVLPGETLVVKGGRVVERRRITALPAGGPSVWKAPAALIELDRVMTHSVEVHQRSDVPYGMFFSGGVDSSVLLAMMARLNPRPVRAYTVGFPGTAARDEREHAQAVAAATRADWCPIEFTEDDFWALLPEVAAAMDDPAADYAVLPTYKLAQAVRADGLKVVLSGEGGDELFAGYGRYRAGRRGWPLTRPMRRAGILDGLDLLREDSGFAWRDGIVAAERELSQPGWTRLQELQAVDCADWLPHDLLAKLDRCLMANGVEGRVPFLDPEVAAFAFALPDALKIRRRRGKWVLRRWLQTGQPASRPFSRKRGFTVPIGEWVAARGAELGRLVAAQPGIDEACRPGSVERLFLESGGKMAKAAWTLLFYALWHRRHILGLGPQGGILETLAATGR